MELIPMILDIESNEFNEKAIETHSQSLGRLFRVLLLYLLLEKLSGRKSCESTHGRLSKVKHQSRK